MRREASIEAAWAGAASRGDASGEALVEELSVGLAPPEKKLAEQAPDEEQALEVEAPAGVVVPAKEPPTRSEEISRTQRQRRSIPTVSAS